MKKIQLLVLTAIAALSLSAHASTQMDEAQFDAALERAMMRADIKVACGSQMALLAADLSGNLTAEQTVRMENAYSERCIKAIQKAVFVGYSEEEILSLLQE